MKPLRITDEDQNKLIENFKEFLKNTRFQDGTIHYTRSLMDLQGNQPKPTLTFTADAMLKMKNLVATCTEEVGWHGTVERNGMYFLVTDIILYPQVVTGATTNAKEPEYANWLMEQPDEIFNKIRFQGHSHVNFGVTPSGVDTNFYEKILNQLQDNDYFIFMILNKRDQYSLWIYDYSCNTIFEDKEILLRTQLNDGSLIDTWTEQNLATWVEQPSKVKIVPPVQPKPITPAEITKPKKRYLDDDEATTYYDSRFGYLEREYEQWQHQYNKAKGAKINESK
jgi:hypothetical protein